MNEDLFEKLLPSSDSSSEEDGFVSKNRAQNFVADVLNYSDEIFRQNFRLSRKVANYLVDLYKKSLFCKTQLVSGDNGISAELRCLLFLWFIGHQQTFTEVANLFNVPELQASTHTNYILDFICKISKNFIKFPSTEKEKAENAKGFEQLAGFPNVIGCIDETFIHIKPTYQMNPSNVAQDRFGSIKFQAICDANKKFIDVSVGSLRWHDDSKEYKRSCIAQRIPKICGKQYHILGDVTYSLRIFMLTPYKDNRNLTAKQMVYNERHSQTIVKIKNTLGLLKQRFRQLICPVTISSEMMRKVIIACCVLHNMCIKLGDLWDDEPGEEISDSLSESKLRHLGEIKRTYIAEKL